MSVLQALNGSYNIILGNDNMSVSMTHFPDLSLSLPFTDIATDPIIGSSVWSIQLSKNNRRVTTLEAPISITFAHTIKVSSSHFKCMYNGDKRERYITACSYGLHACWYNITGTNCAQEVRMRSSLIPLSTLVVG